MVRESLDQWLEYIASMHPGEIELGLDRLSVVYKRIGLEKPPKKVVVVAGTNGKGSTIALIEAGLISLGMKVGVYTSPHILKYNERVRVNGSDVSNDVLVAAFERVDLVREGTALTYFEFGTLAAIDVLFNAELDVVLLEIGLGGRLDAVNIVDADLSIITSIGIDHTDWLGDTLDEIAIEKAGILRESTSFIAGEHLPECIYHRAELLGCPTLTYGRDFRPDLNNQAIVDFTADIDIFLNDGSGCAHAGKLSNLRLPLNNILIAIQAIKWLCNQEGLSGSLSKSSSPGVLPISENGYIFDFSVIKKALEALSIPGRLEELSTPLDENGQREFFVDVGHNCHAAHYLKQFLWHKKNEGKFIQVVYSSLKDKDVGSLVEVLLPVVDQWIVAPLDVDRSLTLMELETIIGKQTENMLLFDSVNDAIAFAIGQNKLQGTASLSEKPILTLMFGSFFMVEAAKKYLINYE
jgi:dihydrofolate synthase/folylpolyglutamate synthase